LIVTRAPGYRIAVDATAVDAARFETAAAQARDAMRRKDLHRAAELLREGLDLWRGEPLADIPAPFAEAERARLDEMRLGATADRVDADLALGLGSELVAELEALTTRYPLRERSRGSVALTGRRANRGMASLHR
jgi:DNA-binding SARP family transcriptional activator